MNVSKPRNLIFVVLSIVIAVVCANALTPTIYRWLPSDFERTKLILNTLDSKHDAQPEIVLFGNSILMSGVDARLLSENLEGSPLSYNLSSTGQTYSESLLFYELLPGSVTTVVQFIRAEQLVQPPPVISDETAGNFYMFGYVPGPITRSLIPADQLSYFDKPQWTANYEARTIIPNSINRSIRGLIRKDLNLTSVARELYFPNVYQKKLDEVQFAKMAKMYNPEEPIDQFVPNLDLLTSIRQAALNLQKRNIRYLVAIHPINPRLFNFTNQYRNQIEKLIETEKDQPFKWISCVSMLDETDFVDHWHVSREGAAKLTKQVAAKIQEDAL